MTTEHQRLYALVSGLVQGVSYRAFTQRQAQRLTVSGWVRNLPDGRVELVAEGPPAALTELVARLREGPPASHVTLVDDRWGAPTGEFARFEIRR